ncbi:hypothetical protein [Desertivirga arenae]|uniref:hypothetical protein n=1 Tax=Desertivirga arenae TaxID=2810309 RepID=UPI001A95C8D8|nr:hypothetical protein [Pedobacter sp. SYSU D00823]
MLKKTTLFYSTVISIISGLLFGCKEKNKLVFEISSLVSIDRVDTLEVLDSGGIYILGLVRNGPLGDFSYDLGLAKHLNSGKQMVYEAKINPNIFRIFKEYLAFVDKEHASANIGWYYVKNGQIQDSLLRFNEIKDSIRSMVSKDANIVENRGNIDAYFKKNQKKSFKYEDFILTKRRAHLENLEYGLYMLDKGILRKVSDNAEDIYNKSAGTFYIPSPGLGITNKWEKKRVLQALDSISKSSKLASNFTVDEERTR